MQYAKEVGLDMARFQKSLMDGKHKSAIDADAAEAVSLGATGTPAFYVNGRYLSGARPFEDFAKLINEELTKLKLPIPAAAQSAAPSAGANPG